MVPTEAGERLLAQVLPTPGQLGAALAELTRHAGEPVGRLRLCAPEPPSRGGAGPVLIDYLVSYPRMQVEVEELELMPRLIEDGYDAASFLRRPAAPGDDLGSPGPQQRYLVVGSPTIWRGVAPLATPRICASTTASATGSPHHHYRWAFAAEGAAGDRSDGPAHHQHACALPGGGRGGARARLLPEGEVFDALASGRLVSVLDDWSPSFAGFNLFYPGRHQLGQGLRALIDMLKEYHRIR